jgi:hypothetical protein
MSVRFGNRLRRRQGGVTYRPPPKAGEIKMVLPPRQPWQTSFATPSDAVGPNRGFQELEVLKQVRSHWPLASARTA